VKVAISQPTYLPWMGYLDLIDQVDLFVILDNVQFAKQTWQQRNRIRTAAGLQWLTVPVKARFGQSINEIEIRSAEFQVDHLRAIELAYRRTPQFQKYFDGVSNGILNRGSSLLVDVNLSLLAWIMEALGIKTPTIRASRLGQSGKRTELLANICSELGATEYISPAGSAAYLLAEQEFLRSRGVDVFFQHYEHPVYQQLYEPFIPFASVVDVMFNEGDEALNIVRSGRKQRYSVDEMRELQLSSALAM
jgi:hypothetical protein